MTLVSVSIFAVVFPVFLVDFIVRRLFAVAPFVADS